MSPRPERGRTFAAGDKRVCARCSRLLLSYNSFQTGWPDHIRYWCLNRIPLRVRLKLWWRGLPLVGGRRSNVVSDRGGKFGFVYKARQNVYRKLVGRYGKEKAARIANAGRTKAGRSAMAKKAARTRRK